jgi:putative hydrolase of the HAD superfamily
VLQAVLFDLDGTLLNRKLAHEQFMLDQAARFSADLLGVSPQAYLEIAMRFDRNGMAARKESFPQIGRELALSDELTERLMGDYRARFAAWCTLFPNETLDALRRVGLRLGLITNGSTVMQGGKLDAVGLRAKLDAILISEAEGCHKPDQAIFHLAAARLGTSPSHCLFVGDNPDNDVRGGKAAGMRAVWVRDAWWDEPSEADAVVDEVSQLLPLIESWRA